MREFSLYSEIRAHEVREISVPVTPQDTQGAPSPMAPPPGPNGAPMTQPSPNDGARQMGMVQVETALQMLEQALPQLGSNTPEGEACLKAMGILAKVYNRTKSQDLVPAQIQELARAQQQTPIQQMMGGAPAPAAAPMPA